MNEAFIRTIIQQALVRLGAVYHHPPDYPMAEERTRPDIITWTNYGGAVIEVKDVPIKLYRVGPQAGLWSGSFPFKEIKNGQRHYADSLLNSDNHHFIGIGPTGGRFGFREIMVIPWIAWRDMEDVHWDKTSVYWTTVKKMFYADFGLGQDEHGYFFMNYHPLVKILKNDKPFKWLDKDDTRSRRFAEPEKKRK